MSPAEVLRAAADKLEGGHWIQGESARNSHTRRPVASNSPRADCWCAYGALNAVTLWPEDAIGALHKLINLNLSLDSARGLIDWNDDPSRTEAEVVAAMRSAADRLEATA